MIRTILSSVVEGLVKRFSGTGRVGEVLTDGEAMEHYGFTSIPQPGAEGIVLQTSGSIIMIASDDRRYRISLEAGEVAIYDDLGQKVHLTRTGIVVSSPSKITAEAPEIDLDATTNAGQININGPGGACSLSLTSSALTLQFGGASIVINSSGIALNSNGGLTLTTQGAITDIEGRQFMPHTHHGVTSGPSSTGGVN